MATLQKFKLLATQCAVAGSPTRSPTTSPVIHLRRRRTLRMFLSRNTAAHRLPRHDEDSPDPQRTVQDSPEKKTNELVVSHKLKDLFVSSPPFDDRGSDKIEREALLPATSSSGGAAPGRRGGHRSLRPLSATLRQRLLRRAWRPVLVTIDE